MRQGIFSAVVLGAALLPLAEAAVPGRALPKGADNPLVLERVFEAEEGEVQFLRDKNGDATAYLRVPTGKLLPISEVNGSSACLNWVETSARGLPGPGGCELLFLEEDGKLLRVPTYGLREGSIFSLGSPKNRGLDVAL